MGRTSGTEAETAARKNGALRRKLVLAPFNFKLIEEIESLNYKDPFDLQSQQRLRKATLHHWFQGNEENKMSEVVGESNFGKLVSISQSQNVEKKK